MTALQQFIHNVATCQDDETKTGIGADHPQFYVRFVSQMMQQLCEKIDNVREKAGVALQKFFKFTLPHIDVQFSQRDELEALFNPEAKESAGL